MNTITSKKLGFYIFASLALCITQVGYAQVSSATTNSIDKNFMQSGLNKYYPIFNKANNCQGAWANSGSFDGVTNKPYKTGYCVHIDTQKIVDTPNGKRLYVVTTGDVSFDEKGEENSGGHADSGLVGMFVFKSQGNNWVVESANPYMNAGSSGAGLSDWKLQKFSPSVWGFINEHGDTHFGVSGTDYVILIPKGKTIQASWVGSSYGNGGNVDCDDKKNYKACTDMSSKISVDTSNVVNGFYPLLITVDGHDGNKVYKNQMFKIIYAPNKGYVEPKNYPLKDLDY